MRASTERSPSGQRETLETAHYIPIECHSADAWGSVRQDSHTLIALVHIDGQWKVNGLGPYGLSVGYESEVDAGLADGISRLLASRTKDSLAIIAEQRCARMVADAKYVEPFVYGKPIADNALSSTYRCVGLARAGETCVFL